MIIFRPTFISHNMLSNVDLDAKKNQLFHNAGVAWIITIFFSDASTEEERDK